MTQENAKQVGATLLELLLCRPQEAGPADGTGPVGPAMDGPTFEPGRTFLIKKMWTF